MKLRSSERKRLTYDFGGQTPKTKKKKLIQRSFVPEKKQASKESDSSETISEEYEVEKILDKKIYGRTIHYLIKWKDFPNSENSWINAKQLNCPVIVYKFEYNLKKEKRRKEILEKRKKDDAKEKVSKAAYNYDSELNTSLNDFIVRVDKRATKNVKSNEREINKERHCTGSETKHAIKKCGSNKHEVVKNKCDGDKHSDNRNFMLKEADVVKKRPHDPQVTYVVYNAQSDAYKIRRKRHDDSRMKHSNDDLQADAREIIKNRHDVLGIKNTHKNVEIEKNEIVKKRHDGSKHVTDYVQPDVCEVVKKRHDDFEKKHRTETVQSDVCEIVRKRDSGIKHKTLKAQLGAHESVNKKHNDSQLKHITLNIQPDVQEIFKKRRDDSRAKHSNGHVLSDASESAKKRHDGFSRKKPELVQSSTGKVSKTVAQNRQRSHKTPKIQKLHYYVKAPNFPRKRTNLPPSVMGVTFKGTDVLKGLEHFVKTGIAVDPLPNYLYDWPRKTGRIDFPITV